MKHLLLFLLFVSSWSHGAVYPDKLVVLTDAIRAYDVCLQDIHEKEPITDNRRLERAEKRCQKSLHQIERLAPAVSKRIKDRVRRKVAGEGDA